MTHCSLAAALVLVAAVASAVVPPEAAAPTVASRPAAASPQEVPSRPLTRPRRPTVVAQPGREAARPYPVAAAELLDGLAARAGARHGIVVADVRTGKELYARHPGVPRTLAS